MTTNFPAVAPNTATKRTFKTDPLIILMILKITLLVHRQIIVDIYRSRNYLDAFETSAMIYTMDPTYCLIL